MTGQRFGSWTVLREGPLARDRHRQVVCVCDCGRERIVNLNNMKRGQSTRCTSCRSGSANVTHGRSRTAEHRAWCGMITRCTNPRRRTWTNYGGRGITVCAEWRASFEAFLAHVGFRPSPRHSLDRIDNARGYEPGNVRWSTATEQANNRRLRCNALLLTANGHTRTLSEWSRATGLLRETIWARLDRGWSEEQSILTPKGGIR